MARLTQYKADSRGYRARQVVRALEEEEEDTKEDQFEGGALKNDFPSNFFVSRSSDNRTYTSLFKKKR